jgi:hypothetical protein
VLTKDTPNKRELNMFMLSFSVGRNYATKCMTNIQLRHLDHMKWVLFLDEILCITTGNHPISRRTIAITRNNIANNLKLFKASCKVLGKKSCRHQSWER